MAHARSRSSAVFSCPCRCDGEGSSSSSTMGAGITTPVLAEVDGRVTDEEGSGGPEEERAVDCLGRLARDGAETVRGLADSCCRCTVFF